MKFDNNLFKEELEELKALNETLATAKAKVKSKQQNENEDEEIEADGIINLQLQSNTQVNINNINQQQFSTQNADTDPAYDNLPSNANPQIDNKSKAKAKNATAVDDSSATN